MSLYNCIWHAKNYIAMNEINFATPQPVKYFYIVLYCMLDRFITVYSKFALERC